MQERGQLEGDLRHQISELGGRNDHLQGQLHEQERCLGAQINDLEAALTQLQQNTLEHQQVEDGLRGQISELTTRNEQLQAQIEEKERSRGFFG